MVHLRATGKVLRYLGSASPSSGPPDTALEVRSLPERLSGIVLRRLQRLGVPEEFVQAEIHAMGEVCVAPTNDRSVLGTMVDFVHALRYYAAPVGSWDEASLATLEGKLERTPCRVTRPESETIWPGRQATELLATRSGST